MSAYNNNTTLNNTTSGHDGRESNLASTGIDSIGHRNTFDNTASGIEGASGLDTTGQRNNLEDAFNRQPADQRNDLEGSFNRQPSGQLNEPHTHSNIPSTTGNDNNLDYSGPDAEIRKIDQTNRAAGSYGHTAGQDLNSQSNRTAGTGIPPVNTAEHIRRNAAEEAIDSGRYGGQNSNISDLSSSGRSHRTTGTGVAVGTALSGDHGASQHNMGVDFDDATQRHAGVPQHAGLAHGKNEHGVMDATDSKPSASDKIKGNLEKLAGKITGDESKVTRGENIAQGGRNSA